ncbi:MAG TPA: biopolymer transporter ExbD [Pyrinomonadaceae bacterium]|jgi:biopolymer transport protein ExbD
MRPDSARASAQAAPHINVTPLIDVLLVLLIIFMVLSPLRATRFKALVPSEPTPRQQPAEPNPLTIVVTVERDLRLRLNGGGLLGSTADPSMLTAELHRRLLDREAAGTPRQGVIDPSSLPPAERIEKTVFVKAPRSVRYGEVVRVIDQIKGVGANPVGLQIDELDR